MEKQINLSIIIPHKNSVTSLLDLIKTIPIDEKIEIVIVDDHSNPDEVMQLEIVKNLNPYVKILENESNTYSAGKARNIGLKHAKGNWLLFADADDLFLDNLAIEFEKIKDSDADVVYYRPLLKNCNGHMGFNTVKVFDIYFENPSKENQLLLMLYMDPPWSKLIKHDLVRDNKIKFDEVKKHNDTLFSKKVAIYAKKVELINRSIYEYNVHSSGITGIINREAYLSIVDVQSRSIFLLKEKFNQKELMEGYPGVYYMLFKLLADGIKTTKKMSIIKDYFRVIKENGLFHSRHYSIFLAFRGYYKKKKKFGR